MRPAPAGCNDHAPTICPGTIPPPLTCKDVNEWDAGSRVGIPKEAAVQEFAELVRALKARDGRSYEALGRRLSVSASTLHRHCSGTTVQEELAAVDRLALLRGVDKGLHERCNLPWPVDLSRPRTCDLTSSTWGSSCR
ncbi:helix-turn-helix domain-containing protein [Streptomyces cyaneofuscatus]|uniref:helix-turn-helix domain-containing protein n=1 Tax=Streptomyces cyaneofuscatus TaxID=66883 RepID=UPI0037DA356D